MTLQELLTQHTHMGVLTVEERDALAAVMPVSEHGQGHIFIEEGTQGDTLFLLLEGEVWVTRTRAGATHELKLLRAGELFGMLALLDNEPRSASCVAARPVKVAMLSRSAFTELYNSHAPVAAALQNTLVAQLTDDFRNLNRQICEALLRAQ